MKSAIKKLLPRFVLNAYYSLWPFVGSLLYGRPSKKLTVVGITGTNGKTSVTHILTQLLEGAGHRVASISSLRFKIGEEEWVNNLKMTMPGRFRVQRFLRDAHKAGCTMVVMEVTSEGIAQKRHLFVDFDTAVFTNLTPEHIESHGSLERYRAAKGDLFARARRFAVVNLDDPSAEYFLSFPVLHKVGYRVSPKQSTRPSGVEQVIDARDVQLTDGGASFAIDGVAFYSPLYGVFNVANALAAIATAHAHGVALSAITASLKNVSRVPGRVEVVADDPCTVIVDYAHTPDALEKVYRAARSYQEQHGGSGRILCVLGATGGGRDKWKRPVLGKLAGQYCDRVLFTDEDPYDEDPQAIIDEVAAGAAESSASITRVLDRREAIAQALSEARKGDAVVITGKGAEPLMMGAHGARIPWDDRKIVQGAVAALKRKG